MTDLSGPVDVCIAVPKLSLDRPFTYLLPQGTAGAGVGTLVSVPFHGRAVDGWILGPAEEVPPGRLLPIRKVRSAVRFFDGSMLQLLRWVSERYLAPLATVIERSHPPRVAGEERRPSHARRSGEPAPRHPAVAIAGFEASRVTWFRPLPGEEGSSCVQAVRACLAEGRRALVLVPEADPPPYTARAVQEAFGERAIGFLGGDGRERFGAWLRIQAGLHDVVVGTRPAVFAPLEGLGLIWVSREVHPAHREDRAPYYHVREVAAARARIEGAACVLASFSPSVDTAAAVAAGTVMTRTTSRQIERLAAPLVETSAPEAEDRSARLASLLKRATSGALIISRTGYGLARVCRSCGAPAACAVCGGWIVIESGAPVCRACGAPGRCRRCGHGAFGVERGGLERVVEWAQHLAPVPVTQATGSRSGDPARRSRPLQPGPDRIVVGTAATVGDIGPVRFDLVGILDPDRAVVRSDLHAPEQVMAVWMEAAAWAGPKRAGGRVLVQTHQPGSPAIQALVRWDPLPFLTRAGEEQALGGFPPNHATFRVEGPVDARLGHDLRALDVTTLLETAAPAGTVCLVAVRPDALRAFRAGVLELVAAGTVTRVEAEPSV